MNQELIDKIALLKEELRELIDSAEVEKRSLMMMRNPCLK